MFLCVGVHEGCEAGDGGHNIHGCVLHLCCVWVVGGVGAAEIQGELVIYGVVGGPVHIT